MKRLLFGLGLILCSEILAQAQSNAPPTNPPAPLGQTPSSPKSSVPASAWDIEWAKWAGNLLTSINLTLVIYLFVQTQRLRQVERKEDVARSVALFWVQDLILKPNLDVLHK